MSRAFVKEPDGDAVADDQPDRPQSPHPNYVTPAGRAGLADRLADLRARHQALRAEGERIDNKLALGRLEREIRYVEGRLERAIVVDPTSQPAGEVCFGALVEVEDDAGQRLQVTIVGEDEADVEAGEVSWISPLARALLGSRVGDVVVWKRPAGDAELEILSIRYPRG